MINCPISLSKVVWKKKENSVSQNIKSLCGHVFSYNAGLKRSVFWQPPQLAGGVVHGGRDCYEDFSIIFRKQLPDESLWPEGLEIFLIDMSSH